MPNSCLVAVALTVGMVAVGGGAASAQGYPTRPIRIITAPAGAGNDFMARVIAQGLTATLGQQLVVDNRPAGLVGELVAKAPADGYTLMAIGSVLWLTPLLQDNVPYDPVKDFSPISLTSRSVNLLVVHPSVAANSVKELIALARAKNPVSSITPRARRAPPIIWRRNCSSRWPVSISCAFRTRAAGLRSTIC